MSINQIRDFCQGVLDACDQADPNEPSICLDLVKKLLSGFFTIWETIPPQTQKNIAKPQTYAIIRQSTEAPHSAKIKPRTENTITIDATLLKEFHNWIAFPADVFDRPSLSLKQGIVKYITNAEEADYIKDIRLRFIKWMFYRCRASWGRRHKQSFLKRLEEDGTEVDERKCSRWLHHGKVYDLFVERWGTGVLIIIPFSCTEAEKVPVSEENNKNEEANEKNTTKRRKIFEDLERRGIQKAANDCATVGEAFENHLLQYWKSVGLFKEDHTTWKVKRKSSRFSSTTENQRARKKSKPTDLACPSSSLDDHRIEFERCVTIHSTPEPENAGMASRRSFDCTLGPAATASQGVVLRSRSTPHTLAEPEATDGPSPAPAPEPRQESWSHVPIREAPSSQQLLEGPETGLPHQPAPSSPPNVSSTLVQQNQSPLRTTSPMLMAAEVTKLSTGIWAHPCPSLEFRPVNTEDRGRSHDASGHPHSPQGSRGPHSAVEPSEKANTAGNNTSLRFTGNSVMTQDPSPAQPSDRDHPPRSLSASASLSTAAPDDQAGRVTHQMPSALDVREHQTRVPVNADLPETEDSPQLNYDMALTTALFDSLETLANWETLDMDGILAAIPDVGSSEIFGNLGEADQLANDFTN